MVVPEREQRLGSAAAGTLYAGADRGPEGGCGLAPPVAARGPSPWLDADRRSRPAPAGGRRPAGGRVAAWSAHLPPAAAASLGAPGLGPNCLARRRPGGTWPGARPASPRRGIAADRAA